MELRPSDTLHQWQLQSSLWGGAGDRQSVTSSGGSAIMTLPSPSQHIRGNVGASARGEGRLMNEVITPQQMVPKAAPHLGDADKTQR